MFITPMLAVMTCLMITSTIMVVSSSNWMMAWISLELNLLSFIPMMLTTKLAKEEEAAVTYFLAQALGSAIFLFSSIQMTNQAPHLFLTMTFSLSLALKLGAAPCHFWFPAVMKSLSWLNCLILATWQKIAPLSLLSYSLLHPAHTNTFFIILAGASALTGGIMGLNQAHIRSILAFSSITHLGWALSALSFNCGSLSLVYFALYSLIITPIFLAMMKFNLTSTCQFPSSNLNLTFFIPLLSILLLSLAGVPPLTGFLPKWMIISKLSLINPWLMLTLLLGSFMNLYFYLNLILGLISTLPANFSHTHSETKSSAMPLIIISATSLLGMIPMFTLN